MNDSKGSLEIVNVFNVNELVIGNAGYSQSGCGSALLSAFLQDD